LWFSSRWWTSLPFSLPLPGSICMPYEPLPKWVLHEDAQ
jgi:hypothetical protein